MDIKQVTDLLSALNSLSCNNSTPEKPAVNKGRYIVVGKMGVAIVGDLVVSGPMGYMRNASEILVWGVSGGLGELALEGRAPGTKLGPCGNFEFAVSTTCGMFEVSLNSDL